MCDRSVVEAAWLKDLGFTYKQQTPLWIDQDKLTYHTPVGSEVYFYCNDTRRRPRKDSWDQDESDGVIYAYCTPTATFDITMNPPGARDRPVVSTKNERFPAGCSKFGYVFLAEWERCKRKCPAAKPEAPVPNDPNARLIPFDSDLKWQRTHWEDEEITYGCLDPNLVIDKNTDNIKSVQYKCDSEGEYAVPAGTVEDPWPVCTSKPYDPGT